MRRLSQQLFAQIPPLKARLKPAPVSSYSTQLPPLPSLCSQSSALSAAFSLHVLPGSFNPPHDGHARMMAAALVTPSPPQLLCSPADTLCLFELSVVNVDKAPPSPPAILRRVRQFFAPESPTRQSAMLITKSPRFIEKSSVPRPHASRLPSSVAIILTSFAAAAGGQLQLRHRL